jgi:hypothetical protein
MSTVFSVYVGPFLACKEKPGEKVDAYKITSGRLANLRGELSQDDGEIVYLGPNIKMLLIHRQLTFDQHSEPPVTTGLSERDERAAFIDQFFIEITALRPHYESVSVEWGVIPGVL